MCENEVNTIVVSVMGAKSLQRLAETGIKVLFVPKTYSDDVQSLVDGVLKNELSPMEVKKARQGHVNCHH